MGRGPDPVPVARRPVLGTGGVVTSSSPFVSLAGARVLADGGTAIDATLAMAAVAWMVLPGQCGLGGDAFAIVREPDGEVWTVSGSGFGPDGGTPELYAGLGLDALPLTGPHAVAVPGAPAAVRTLQGRATRGLDELWAPALRLAREGVAASAKTRADVGEFAAALDADPGARAAFLPGGVPPEVGARLRQADLATTLERLAADPDAFYTGWFADRAVEHLVASGAPYSGAEWAAVAHAPVAPAIATAYGGARLHQTPMPSAGWMVLQQAALCDGELVGSEQLGAPAVHWLAEAAAAAFRDRFASCGSDTDAWQRTLDPAALERTRAAIRSRDRVGPAPMRVAGDTTSTVCVDADGRAVSFIHSLGFTFGARLSVPGTGVILNNRLGRGAYLIDGHPNEVRPRRKPLHTLNAWLLDEPGVGLLHAGNCPGGDGQVQWNMQVISHLVDHGDDPQRAVSLPRFTVFPGSDADVVGRRRELRCEGGIPATTLETLGAWGHDVVPVPVQVGGPGGSALAISMDHRHGCVRAGADPRMEGVALAV
ncbi:MULTISPECIES: gamma-glutamyltransferase [unclassified Nocardioides]|uniref:gamma-glutamyltransferase n=1 Tax=unclassified Nocardioides TaxID=2615069 RepID=UPI0002E68366|nr:MULTISPECIES: gamma-glutamyltransferase [unclassified Nocardioides]